MIIEGIQIRIPLARRRANRVTTRMQALLDARKCNRVSRRAFLSQWAKLRRELFLTTDYQDLRNRIAGRNGGLCEKCNWNVISHVHHIEPVAFRPDLALVDSNCKGMCRECHREEHRAKGS